LVSSMSKTVTPIEERQRISQWGYRISYREQNALGAGENLRRMGSPEEIKVESVLYGFYEGYQLKIERAFS